MWRSGFRPAVLGGRGDLRTQAGQLHSGLRSVSQGEGLNLAISKEEVRVHIGDGECLVKTLTLTHLYCEPPPRVPQPSNGSGTLLQFVVRLGPQAQAWVWAAGTIRAEAQESCASHHPQVQMGNVRLALGPVQYEVEPMLSAFPVEAQVGLGIGAALLIAAVLLLTLMYR